MKITALVENQSSCGLRATHGLSLYIETPKHKLLFDVGPDETLFHNAEKLGIDLSAVDLVILSHGHRDHGGALEAFLKINSNAKIYAQRKAFEKHYSKLAFSRVPIGVSSRLKAHPQVVLLDGDSTIDEELHLFTASGPGKCYSNANDTLLTDSGKDDFSHEQSLMILGDPNALIMGCGHIGIVNILEKAAGYHPRLCVGGYHLWNPVSRKTVPDELLESIAQELAKYPIAYYTCHCTGQSAYEYLAKRLPRMAYLSCGETIEE